MTKYRINIILNFENFKPQSWKDEFLKWNPMDYDNIIVSRIKFDDIWTAGKRLFVYFISIIIMDYTKKWFLIKKDTFLYNAADSNSWHQWDTTS
jgi:hypothetical protein